MRVPSLVAWLLITVLGAGCGLETAGVRLPNQPPHIRITAGPMEDSLHSYRVTFYWTAHDPDGSVAGFEYAIDDTAVVDSLHQTARTWASLLFPVEDWPKLDRAAGPVAAVDTLSRYHTFYVRARDNEDHRSAFASASFNAFTIAPTTSILIPDPRFVPQVGTTFEVVWEGHDLDSPSPPARFSTRLVWVPPDSAEVVDIGRLERPGGGDPWTPFMERTLIRFSVIPGAYLFGVKALDEAGAVEQRLRIGTNVTRLRVVDEPGLPSLTLTAGGKTVELPTDDDEDKTFSMISGQSVVFTWSASAAAYGARITEYAYGIDLEGLDPQDPGWILTPESFMRLRFDNPPGVEDTTHVLYLRVSDSIGQDLVADALLAVAPPDLSRDILYVDDIGHDRQGSSTSPPDSTHDRWVLEVLLAEAQRRGMRIDEYEVQYTRGGRVPGAPDLAVLRRYRSLVWSVKGSGTALQFSMDPEETEAVANYVALGGNLWVLGNSVLVSMALPPTPTYLFGFAPGEIGYDVLHVETLRDGGQITAGGFLRGGGNPVDRRVDGLAGAVPTPPALAEGWPLLAAVREPYGSGEEGIPHCEGMLIGYEHRGEGVLDTLYTYVANGRRIWPPLPSVLDDAPCAFRYRGPRQGKVLVTSFPVDWWSEAVADSLGRSALRWFLDEAP